MKERNFYSFIAPQAGSVLSALKLLVSLMKFFLKKNKNKNKKLKIGT